MNLFRVALVVALAAGALGYKQQVTAAAASEPAPTVLLVADLREAGESNDGCAQIIREVRSAAARGVRVKELTPDSTSPLLKIHRVVTIPTVLIFGADGREETRFVGEDDATIRALRTKLAELTPR